MILHFIYIYIYFNFFYFTSSIFKPGDSFVGYHSDTAASIIMKVSKDQPTDKEVSRVICILFS